MENWSFRCTDNRLKLMCISNKRTENILHTMPKETELLNKGANNLWSDLRGHASGQ